MRTPFSLLLVCSLTALAHGQAPAKAGTQDRDFDTAWRGVTKRLKERVEKHGIVGASLAFVHRGRLIAQWQHGFADL
ncbi:MAG: hypothetical protein ACYS5W_22155, partial [Planctomycetota bacterium]